MLGAMRAREGLALLARAIAAPDCGRELLRGLRERDATALLELAFAHGVDAWLAEVVDPADRAWAVGDRRLRFVAARVRARRELDAFAAIADAGGWPWLTLKGQALAEDVYPRPHMRFGVDADVLVAPADFPAVVAALTDSGWRLLDRNWPLVHRVAPAQLRMQSPRGQLFDVHWHLVNSAQQRGAFTLPTRDLLDRRRALPSGLPVLSVADGFVHVALHAALSGATKLLWLADTHLAGRAMPAWGDVAAAVRASGTGVPVATTLNRAARWFPDSPAPAELHGPAAWRAICRTVDGVSPLGEDPARPSISRSFASASLPTRSGTLVSAARRGTAWVRSGAPRRRAVADWRDPESRASALHAVDDPSARQAYFATVTSAR